MAEINSIEDLINLSDDEIAQLNTDFSSESSSEDGNEEGEETIAPSSEEDTETAESSDEDDTSGEEEEDSESESDSDSEDEEDDTNDDDDVEDEIEEEDDSKIEISANESDLIEKILKNPIRANNRDIQIKDADEAVRLIQMGFGMQEKARKLKPHMKHIKTLEKANLLDESKINFSIDLLNGNQSAILQLLKDNDIDPLDLAENNPESSYVPTNHSISNEHVQFEEQLESIKDSPKSKETISYVSGLDDESFSMVKKDPNTISVINNLMESGYHDKIVAAKDKAELLRDPLISGKSDLEAYLLIGARLDKEGAFSNDPAPTKSISTHKSTSTQNNRKKADVKKKKAASTNSGGNSPIGDSKEGLSEEDFAKMSDEEFLKYVG